jgi:A/G-specific adenine glycosylase
LHKIIDETTNFPSKLINWYRDNKRDLPWRTHRDPYKIWLSEIILQQTRVAQGLAYYEKFIKHYPSVNDLARASEDKVLKDWQGLGYYSRARNLHASAKIVAEEFEGYFPKNYQEIKSLKGIGDYTAAAIASFAYDLPYPVLDGNVYRLLSRFYGIFTPIDTPKAKKEFIAIAESLMPKDQAAEFNQAIMEFGALQCIPKNPNCSDCIFNNQCYAYSENQVGELPKKKNKIKQRKRHFHYLIIESENQLIIKQRKGKGIWQNLYDFPLIETSKPASLKNISNSLEFKSILERSEYEITSRSDVRKHILSHQIILANFYHLKVKKIKEIKEDGWLIVKQKELVNFAIPKLIENYLVEETNLLSLLDT